MSRIALAVFLLASNLAWYAAFSAMESNFWKMKGYHQVAHDQAMEAIQSRRALSAELSATIQSRKDVYRALSAQLRDCRARGER